MESKFPECHNNKAQHTHKRACKETLEPERNWETIETGKLDKKAEEQSSEGSAVNAP